MRVKWDDQTYEVIIQRTNTPSITVSADQSGKAFAKVPRATTDDALQRYLDKHAEQIANMIRNAEGTKQEPESKSIVGDEHAATVLLEDTDPSLEAIADERTLVGYLLSRVPKAKVQTVESEDARRVTMHIVGPRTVALSTPLGASPEAISEEMRRFLPFAIHDLAPELSPRQQRSVKPLNFPYIQDLRTCSDSGEPGRTITIYSSRRKLPYSTYEAISEDEVWAYIPWYVPTNSVPTVLLAHSTDIVNAASEYAYRHGKNPARFPKISTEHVTRDGADYDLEVRREPVAIADLSTPPAGTRVLRVPWALPYGDLRDALDKNPQLFVSPNDKNLDAMNSPSSEHKALDAQTAPEEDVGVVLNADDAPLTCTPILGQKLYVQFVMDEASFVEQTSDKLIVYSPTVNARKTTFLTWCEDTLKPIIERFMDDWHPVVSAEGVGNVKFAVCDTDGYWTRSVSRGFQHKIQFSLNLLHMPMDVIEYAVLEQLVAMIPRRSEAWRESFMDTHMPDWREYARQLGYD